MKENNRVDSYVTKIAEFIVNKQYKKIVLQLPRQLLPISFDLTSSLKKEFPQRDIYTLYDSLKQPCCTDTLGAEHINYDCLIHFGRACFSSPHQPNHFYIFQEENPETRLKIKGSLGKLGQSLALNNIGYLLVDQSYYQFVNKQIDITHLGIQLLRLSHDAEQGDQYVLFGYYARALAKQHKNILVVADQIEEQSQQMSLLEKISFTLKSLNSRIGQKLFKLGDSEGQIVQVKANLTKRLMQRYSIASQLEDCNVFGILVSNTGASFVNQTIKRCQEILKNNKKKSFLFMMNNLNEVKLGNFPEIQVYVIVSCFNHSLFSVKDFHRLVVTPTDLQIAFEKRNFDEYGFDLNSEAKIQHKIHLPSENKEQSTSTEIEKAHNQEVALQNTIQTLAYYQQREFKGLVFNQKKEIKKMTKGKIGLAQQYTNLE